MGVTWPRLEGRPQRQLGASPECLCRIATLTDWLALQRWAPFLNSAQGINGFTDSDVGEFRKDAATALIYLQREEIIAKSLNDEYTKTKNSE
jgi:hypothetical protein